MIADPLFFFGVAIGVVSLLILIQILRILRKIWKRIDTRQDKTIESDSNEKIDYIYNYFKIKESIRELDRFTTIYAEFLTHVEEELDELASGKVQGPEYVRRQRLVEFALNMALVYARIEGNKRMIPKIEEEWERARDLH